MVLQPPAVHNHLALPTRTQEPASRDKWKPSPSAACPFRRSDAAGGFYVRGKGAEAGRLSGDPLTRRLGSSGRLWAGAVRKEVRSPEGSD